MTDEEKQFIRDHFKTIQVRVLAKRMGRGAKTIYEFVKAENVAIVDPKRRYTQHHPWRKANFQLECYKQACQKNKL